MPEERTIAVIPKLIVVGVLGPKEYVMVVTSHRFILGLERASNFLLGGALAGTVGMLIAEAVAKRRVIDYNRTSLEELARDGKNITIPYSNIRKLVFKGKPPHTCSLRVDYLRPDGKKKRIDGQAVVPPEWVKRKKAEGGSRRDAVEDLVHWIHGILLQALPAEVSSRAVWKV